MITVEADKKVLLPEKGIISPYLIFTLLFLLYMFDYIDRTIVGALFPFLKRDWGISDAQCGLLVSAVYWSILIFSLPVSILVDRWSRKKSIGLMALLWSLATLACAFTRNFGQLFIARTAIGIGEAGYAPGGTAMISAMFPAEKRARMLGFWNASIPLGSALGIVLGGLIAEHFGWRHAFGIVALPGALVALLFFYVRDYQTIELLKPEDGNSSEGDVTMSKADIISHFARNRTLLFNNLAFAANTFVTTSLLTWLPTYFHRLEGLPMSKAATKGGLVMLMAIAGAPLGGYLADRWLIKRENARLLFPAASSFITSGILFAALTLGSGSFQYLTLLLAGFTAVMFVPAAVAVTQDVAHPGLRAVSLSLCVIIQHILGSSLGPPFIGMLSDRYGLKVSLMALPLFTALAGVLFMSAAGCYSDDLARMKSLKVDSGGQ